MAVPFLAGFLTSAQLRVRFAFGADPRSDPAGWTWTDLTADVLQDNGRVISITIGKGPESGSAAPAQCTLALDNRTGDYTQFSGKSQYYPNLRETLPMWVEVFVSGSWRTRFFGFCKGFTPAWDTTGNYAISKVDAYGVTRRLIQGKAKFRSALYRGITLAGPSTYYPMEDGTGAGAAASGISGQALSAAGVVNFGKADGIPGSSGLANFSAGGLLSGPVSGASGGCRISFAARFPIIQDATAYTITAVRNSFDASSTLQYVDLYAAANSSTGLSIRYSTVEAGVVTFGTGLKNDGNWHWYDIDFSYSLGAANIILSQDGAGAPISVSPPTASLGAPATVSINPAALPADFDFGQYVIWPDSSVDTYAMYLGNVGETPEARMTRLAAEQGEVYATIGTYVAKASMGAQGMDSFMDLIRECELADAGYLYDGLSQGMRFQGVADRYNATSLLSLDASAGQVQPDFAPVGDDLGRVNSMTVSRKAGSTATYTDETGPLGTDAVGIYDNSITINIESDGPLEHRAGWEVALGTIEGFRYPSLAINLRSIPTKAVDWVTVLPGSTITVTPPYSTQLPTDDIKLIVQGWTEQLTNLRWEVEPINCSPALIFQQLAVYAAAASGSASKFDAGGSSTNATSTTTATSIVVKTSGGALWVTTAGEFPFDINIAGEKIQVTAISGASSPQTFTVVRSRNGVVKTHAANEPVHLWAPARFAF